MKTNSLLELSSGDVRSQKNGFRPLIGAHGDFDFLNLLWKVYNVLEFIFLNYR